MKIYLAAPWAHRGDMAGIAAQIEGLGHSLTWKWWETPDIPEGDWGNETKLREQAKNDLEGVRSADLVVVINSAKSEGKAFEQGVAISHGKPIIIVGKRGEHSQNVFHYLTEYRWVDDVNSMLEVLETIKWLLRE
jgi:nucleoside 2-deoxyribosyltransferase